MITFIIALLLLLVLAAVVNVARRFLSGWKIYDLHLPGRLPIWVAAVFWPVMVIGLLLMVAEIIGRPGVKPGDTWGAKIALIGGGGFLGGWLGGALASYVLQYFTAWGLGPTPPVVVVPPPKS